ncbi:hypothetical protein VTN96DRAFT_3365 [Rasamsonia emersonii]
MRPNLLILSCPRVNRTPRKTAPWFRREKSTALCGTVREVRADNSFNDQLEADGRLPSPCKSKRLTRRRTAVRSDRRSDLDLGFPLSILIWRYSKQATKAHAR